MELPAPTPLQERVLTLHNKCRFSSVYMGEKPASLTYQEKKQLQEKSIIA